MKSRVFQNITTFLVFICVIMACTPIDTQSNPQESSTSTLTVAAPTVVKTKTQPPTKTEIATPLNIIEDKALIEKFLNKTIPHPTDLKLDRFGQPQELSTGIVLGTPGDGGSILGIKQGVLLGAYIDEENSLFINVGLENNNGERTVVPLRASFGDREELGLDTVAIQIDKSGYNRFLTNAENVQLLSPTDALETMKNYLGQVIILTFSLYTSRDTLTPELIEFLDDLSARGIYDLNKMILDDPLLLHNQSIDEHPFGGYILFFENSHD